MIAVAQAAFDPDVEEALLRVYGVDSHRATLRRVSVLLRRLPPGAWQKEQGPASWSREAWMLADVVDAVNQLSWLTAAVNSKSKPERPKPYPRPGDKAKQDFKKVTWSEMGRLVAGSG